MRRATKEFDKTVHYFEKSIETKYFKVPIKIKTNGTKAEFYTPFFKAEENGGKKIEYFESIKDLYEYVEDSLAELTPIHNWERKIYIRVKGHSRHYGVEGHETHDRIDMTASSIEVFSEIIEIGSTEDGRKWKRGPGDPKSIRSFNENIGYGLEKDKYWWKKDDDPGDPYSRALIDDTPENREMLVAFAEKFDILRDQFFRAFGEGAQRFLAASANMKLLTSGDTE